MFLTLPLPALILYNRQDSNSRAMPLTNIYIYDVYMILCIIYARPAEVIWVWHVSQTFPGEMFCFTSYASGVKTGLKTGAICFKVYSKALGGKGG